MNWMNNVSMVAATIKAAEEMQREKDSLYKLNELISVKWSSTYISIYIHIYMNTHKQNLISPVKALYYLKLS